MSAARPERGHLPEPWLCQLIKTSDPASQASLARTCKELWSLVLFNSKKVVLKLNPYQDQEGLRSATCLQLLRGSQKGADVTLVVRAWPYSDVEGRRVPAEDEVSEDWEQADDTEEQAMAANTFWLEALCEQQPGTPGSPLQCVTHLELQGVVLGNLVPTCVVKACFKLRHLTRLARLYCIPGRPFCPTICPQLHSLTLTGMLAGWDDADIDVTQLKQQLRALPSLQALTMRTDAQCARHSDHAFFDIHEADTSDGTAGLWVQGITELSQQLTTLDLKQCWRFQDEELEPLLDVPWLRLERLEWLYTGGRQFHQTLMENLLKHTQRVEKLVVDGFWLLGVSFANRCCVWKQLTIRIRPNLSELAALPLSGLCTLSMIGIFVEHFELHLMLDVAASLARVGSIISTQSDGCFSISLDSWPEAEVEVLSNLFRSLIVQLLAGLRQKKVQIEFYSGLSSGRKAWKDVLTGFGGMELLQAQLSAEVRACGMHDFKLTLIMSGAGQ